MELLRLLLLVGLPKAWMWDNTHALWSVQPWGVVEVSSITGEILSWLPLWGKNDLLGEIRSLTRTGDTVTLVLERSFPLNGKKTYAVEWWDLAQGKRLGERMADSTVRLAAWKDGHLLLWTTEGLEDLSPEGTVQHYPYFKAGLPVRITTFEEAPRWHMELQGDTLVVFSVAHVAYAVFSKNRWQIDVWTPGKNTWIVGVCPLQGRMQTVRVKFDRSGEVDTLVWRVHARVEGRWQIVQQEARPYPERPAALVCPGWIQHTTFPEIDGAWKGPYPPLDVWEGIQAVTQFPGITGKVLTVDRNGGWLGLVGDTLVWGQSSGTSPTRLRFPFRGEALLCADGTCAWIWDSLQKTLFFLRDGNMKPVWRGVGVRMFWSRMGPDGILLVLRQHLSSGWRTVGVDTSGHTYPLEGVPLGVEGWSAWTYQRGKVVFWEDIRKPARRAHFPVSSFPVVHRWVGETWLIMDDTGRGAFVLPRRACRGRSRPWETFPFWPRGTGACAPAWMFTFQDGDVAALLASGIHTGADEHRMWSVVDGVGIWGEWDEEWGLEVQQARLHWKGQWILVKPGEQRGAR